MTTRTSWKGDNLYYDTKAIAKVVRDKTYPMMWRVSLPDGRLTDMVNRARAKDAAEVLGEANERAMAAKVSE